MFDGGPPDWFGVVLREAGLPEGLKTPRMRRIIRVSAVSPSSVHGSTAASSMTKIGILIRPTLVARRGFVNANRAQARRVGHRGVSPARIVVRVEKSMFPPETTQMIVPEPARPDRAAATGSAPAPSAITLARSASSRIAAAV